jgi:two-component system nitrogen regulation sensor histidine kinase NtrY
MGNKTRIVGLAGGLAVALSLFVIGTWLETRIFDGLTAILQNQSFLSVILFFSVVNLNALMAFGLIFLSFRNAVKLVVERQRAVFGSSLRTRLVTLFLFFSLLPTLILLYISTKFVNAHFERWLPPSVEQTSQLSLKSEAEYREKLLAILENVNNSLSQKQLVDFIVPASGVQGEAVYIKDKYSDFLPQIMSSLAKNNKQLLGRPRWLALDDSRFIAVVRSGDRYLGLVSPPTIHNQWRILTNEVTQAQPGIELVRLSYYILLGTITVLLIFSALWLGVTIAREITGPLQSLAVATELVASGNYDVKIDDVVSDDELGQLARGFRAMVLDLRDANQRAQASAHELELKAAQLSEKTEYYASVLQEVQAAVLAVDADLQLEACNPAAEVLFLINESSDRGRSIGDLLPRDFYRNWLHPVLMPLLDQGQKRIVGEFSGRIHVRDCQLVITAHALIKPNGQKGFLVIVEDVTDLARAQRLAAWREVARKVAHEIKNPLTPILLGAQRLERRVLGKIEGEEREILRESLRVIVQSSDTIKQLVDEFVSVARMPGPRLRVGNILETLQLTVAGFAENPEHVSVEIEYWSVEENRFVSVQSNGDLPTLSLNYDPDQISRAFINLISNAISASAENTVSRRVVVRVVGPGPNKSEAEFSVVDWGHGVPEAVRERIFEPYFSTKRTGTGLGLVIVQQIVHEHGGRLWVSANEPRGTVFFISLPA